MVTTHSSSFFSFAASSVIVTVFAALGCSSTPSERPARSAESADTSHKTAAPARDADTASIAVSEDIRKACGLSQAEARFAYNSSRVARGDSDTMSKLATCFKSGPLSGRAMRLVGHADPRGDDEYNLLLGGRRADSVRSALVSLKLSPERIETTSRGELDARGQDESGWSADRRVDVMLGD